MAYADYTFYISTFYGNTIPETSFNKYSDMATDELNHMTLGNIGSISSLASAQQTKVKKAMCSLADVMYGIDQQINNANTTDNVKSKSSGGESISYGTAETIMTKAASDDVFRRHLYYDAVKTYLSGTGYLYAGV